MTTDVLLATLQATCFEPYLETILEWSQGASDFLEILLVPSYSVPDVSVLLPVFQLFFLSYCCFSKLVEELIRDPQTNLEKQQ